MSDPFVVDGSLIVLPKGRFHAELLTNIQAVARRKLRMRNNARVLADLRIPPAKRFFDMGLPHIALN